MARCVGVFIIALFFSACQYIFMFQVPWLPEFTIGLHDYRTFNAIFRGRKAVSLLQTFSLTSLSLYLLLVACRRESRTEISSRLKWWRPTSTLSPGPEGSLDPSTTYVPFTKLAPSSSPEPGRQSISRPSYCGLVLSLSLVSALFAKLHNHKDIDRILIGGRLCKITNFMLGR